MSTSNIESQFIFSPEQLQKLLREFKQQKSEQFQLTALGYFGSYARGEASPDSDVDIVFKTDYGNLLLTSRLRLDLIVLYNRPVRAISF